MRGPLLAVGTGRPEATVISAIGLKSNHQIRFYIVTYFHSDPTTSSSNEYILSPSQFGLLSRSGVSISLKDTKGAHDLKGLMLNFGTDF